MKPLNVLTEFYLEAQRVEFSVIELRPNPLFVEIIT